MIQTERLHGVITKIDSVNNRDPRSVILDDAEIPGELLYSQRMSKQLLAYAPTASEALQIAARAQHIARWSVPRDDYPPGRSGYRKWRSDLAIFHANKTAEIMQSEKNAHYTEAEIERVKHLILKIDLKRDPETQCLEDVICLVFLKYYFTPFAKKHSEEKILKIIRKTWNKMSEKGHDWAMQLPLERDALNLIGNALA